MSADRRTDARSIPLSLQEQIDIICDRFEAAWNAGERPKIEDCFDEGAAAEQATLFRGLLVVELQYRSAAGERPAQEDYERRFPDHVRIIQEVFHSSGTSSPDTSALAMTTDLDSELAGQPGHPTQPDVHSAEDDDPLPDYVGRYQVRDRVGSGSFGTVYLAYDDRLEREVAIKVPRRERIRRPQDVEAYLNEARVVAQLDHPHIVPVHDVGQTEDGRCFVVSKFIEGRDLQSLIEECCPSHHDSAQLVATIAEALHYAHRQRIAHRDIKPANILIDRVGEPHLADFGLALKDEDIGKRPGHFGTVLYMSPEQARGEGHLIDGRSDIFSLGVVLYELLTRIRPFQGSSRHEVAERIQILEARPPRQLDDAIPRELERICLKALSKRATDRYTTARDMADDLRHFLAAQEAAGDSSAAAAMPDEPSRDRPIRIVPKGLRSFDAGDADFFLELLPGPHDRDGLPESIRFWKTQVEKTDPDETFRVGLIYGPSGCGKSSLVKAGLLPRLADNVIPVYVEATAGETETRLLRVLRKCCPDLSDDLGLIETLAALRRGDRLPAGKKVLIVLDQFEQWLHAKQQEETTELVRALRQCDGTNVQCVALVRDDFWMPATHFVHALDIRLVDGENCAAVDLFDQLHARTVLTNFGQAFGRLPDNLSQLTADQEAFLNKAACSLAEEGKVVCVRLALFAEMVKGKTWTPATLAEVGGTEGVGVTFLEETFSASKAPPEHRLHQKAARGVLKVLLPVLGMDIKGGMRSSDELLDASGYSRRPHDFDDLIHILDSAIRLITPTDPAGQEADEEIAVHADPSQKYYQLTHDYLVPSLREWLTRKQKETRRGRAELRLAERAAAWNAKPENRHLPAWWEYLNIRFFTDKKKWSARQRKMMQQSRRHHGVRALITLVILAVLTMTGLEINGRLGAKARVENLRTAKITEVPGIVTEIGGYRRWADDRLSREYADAPPNSSRQLHASLALLPVDAGQVDYLHQRLLDCSAEEFPVIRDSLKPHQAALIPALSKTFRDTEEAPQRRFHAGMALAEYAPDTRKWTDQDADFLTSQLLDSNPDDQRGLRSYLAPIGGRLVRPLEVKFRDPSARDSVREAAANALTDFAGSDVARLARLASEATPSQYRILFPEISGEDADERQVLTALVSLVQEQPSDGASENERLALGKRRAGAAISLVRLHQQRPALDVFRFQDGPESLTQFVHRHKQRGVTPAQLIECLRQAEEVRARFGLLLALGEYAHPGLSAADEEAIRVKLSDWYGEDPSSAIHSACGWLLRNWGFHEDVDKVDHTPLPFDESGQREWFVQSVGDSYFTFAVFQPGEFLMGSPDSEADRDSDESLHKVRLTQQLAVADREVSVAQWQQFQERTGRKYGYSREHSDTPAHPVTAPDWYMAVEYCRWLTQQAGLTETDQCYDNPAEIPEDQQQKLRDGRTVPRNWPFHPERQGFRLPTEAEWEYICRAGTSTTYGFGSDRDLLDKYGWFSDNAGKKTHIGGGLRPNLRGLFDMHGNVYEWCHDWYLENLGDGGQDPSGPLEGETRLLRGGCWLDDPPLCRSAFRGGVLPLYRVPANGFRLVRSCGDHPKKGRLPFFHAR